MGIRFNAEKCIGCRLCQLVCSSTREGVFNPLRACLRVSSEYQHQGGLLVQGNLCDNCGSCIMACPTGAISQKDGGLKLEKEICTGCGDCVRVCPKRVVSLNDQGQPRLCDLCGGAPQCVVWCPHGALEVMSVE